VLLISLTEDEAILAEYLKELFKQFNEIIKLLMSKDVISKKLATVYITLGNALLKLYDQKIDFQDLKEKICKELPLKETDDLSFIRQIFNLAEIKSRQSGFNKADAYDGLIKVEEQQLKREGLKNSEKEEINNSITKYKSLRDNINKALNRVTES
jgi:hypothetical protein